MFAKLGLWRRNVSTTNDRIIFYILFFIVCLSVYLIKFKGFFIADDYEWLEHARLLSEGTLDFYIFHTFRPLFILILSFFYNFFGLNPAPYHMFSLFLHILNCVLFFELIYSFSKEKLLSVLAAFFFCISLAKAPAVYWIAAIPDLLMTSCALLASLFWIKYINNRNIGSYFLCFIIFAVSLFVKETAIVIPVLLISYEFIDKKRIKAPLKTYSPFFLLSFLYILSRFLYFPLESHPISLTILENIAGYITFLVLPISKHVLGHFGAENAELIINSIISIKIIIFLSLLAIFIYVFIKGIRTIQMAIFWIIVPVLPICFFSCPLFMLEDAVRSWYLYLPSIGFSILAVFFIREILVHNRKIWIRSVICLLFLVFIIMNAGGVIIYGNLVFMKEWHYEQKFIHEFDAINKNISPDDILLFEATAPVLSELHSLSFLKTILSLFWRLDNKYFLVYPLKSNIPDSIPENLVFHLDTDNLIKDESKRIKYIIWDSVSFRISDYALTQNISK
ncbi:MAG: glycosyltransferase family 39 protein [Syntrophaceae bacterium]|nr:glycosyltransferase family 39 protein [Syntrophaceae bacterium]